MSMPSSLPQQVFPVLQYLLDSRRITYEGYYTVLNALNSVDGQRAFLEKYLNNQNGAIGAEVVARAIDAYLADLRSRSSLSDPGDTVQATVVVVRKYLSGQTETGGHNTNHVCQEMTVSKHTVPSKPDAINVVWTRDCAKIEIGSVVLYSGKGGDLNWNIEDLQKLAGTLIDFRITINDAHDAGGEVKVEFAPAVCHQPWLNYGQSPLPGYFNTWSAQPTMGYPSPILSASGHDQYNTGEPDAAEEGTIYL